LQAGTITTMVENVNFVAPDGYSFDPVTHMTFLSNKRWMSFVVTGRYQNAKAVIEATIARPRLLSNAGIFGELSLNLQPNVEIFSYDSRELRNPVEGDSTGDADVGSNHGVIIRPGAFIDGVVLLGSESIVIPVGYDYEVIGEVDADPLGTVGGPLENAFTYYSVATNNQNAAAGIAGNRLSLGPHDTLTLPGGSYYLVDLYMPAGSTLIANGTPTNPVVIYLNGEMKIQPNANINTTNGLPSNLFVFSKSDQPVTIQPNGDFRAFVYAPFASVDIKPNVSAYGVFWGKNMYLMPNGNIYIDTSLLDRFLSCNVELVEWRQVVLD
ncbi:MAG: hypothetical protein V2A34_15720, partial [Lentisphaerota bacterium]